MILDSGHGLHVGSTDSLPGLLHGADPELIEILKQVATPELFRRETVVPLMGLGSGPLLVVRGALSLARALLNGPSTPLAAIVAGDIFCPRALHPIVRANAVLLAEAETMAYSVPTESLATLRAQRPDLAAALDRHVNGLLQRLLAETETLLQALHRQTE